MGRSIEEAVVRPESIGLTSQELNLEVHPVVVVQSTIPVRHMPGFTRPYGPDCAAIAWTDRAVRTGSKRGP